MAIYGNIENLDAVILGDITAEPIHIDGEDGRGVVSAQINAQQHLIITYTDGTTEDAGAVGEGAGVVIDPTLSIEGAAAEAKATGEWVERLNDTLNEISVCIPSQASYSNQLADKAFVNSTVGTNTAIFRGTFNSLAELQAYTGEKTNNDYAFVIATDVNGNTVYNRYKFNGSSWVFEYALNNSSFTAAQWAAIESGITAALVASYNAHLANDDIHVTAADKTAWNGKLDKTGGVISGNLGVAGELGIGSTVSVIEENVSLLKLIGDNGEPVRIKNVDTPIADSDVATKKYVDEHSGGGDVFLVTITVSVAMDGAFTVTSASHTHAEILEAIEAGKSVELIVDGGYFESRLPLANRAKDSVILNEGLLFAVGTMEATVDNSNTWTAETHDYALKSDLDNIYTKTETDNAIAAAIGDAIGGSY